MVADHGVSPTQWLQDHASCVSVLKIPGGKWGEEDGVTAPPWGYFLTFPLSVTVFLSECTCPMGKTFKKKKKH